MKPAPLERDVAREIDAYLTGTLGLTVFRADQGGGRFARRTIGVGLPDRYGILPNGRWWAVEIKRPGARPRANEAKQHAVMRYLAIHGALVILASSVEEVRERLSIRTLFEHQPKGI